MLSQLLAMFKPIGDVVFGPYATAFNYMTPVANILKDVPNFFAPLDAALESASPSLGFPVDKLRFLSCMFAAIPLSLIHRELPNVPSLKHAFSAFFGFGFAALSFRAQALHSLIPAVVTYALVSMFGTSSFCPKFVFGFNFLYMFQAHAQQQFANWGGYDLDFTGPQMVLTLKLTQFAWNRYDGYRTAQLAKGKTDKSEPSSTQQRWGLQTMPNPLEFFGYVYFYGSFLAGPSCEISDYLAFTDLSMYQKMKHEANPSQDSDGRPSRLSAIKQSSFKFVIAVACGIGLTVSGMIPVKWVLTPEYQATSLLYKMGYVWLATSLVRQSYYFAWMLADSACTLTGFSYNGKSSGFASSVPAKKQEDPTTENWDRLCNARIPDVDFGQSGRTAMNGWNLGTTHFMRYYIYERLQEAGVSRGTSTTMTMMTSAFWHGFYPGYYITFFMGSQLVNCSRDLREWLRPKFAVAGVTPLWYNIGGWCLTSFVFSHAAISFVLLDVKSCLDLANSMYWIPQLALGACVFVASFGAAKAKKSKKKD